MTISFGLSNLNCRRIKMRLAIISTVEMTGPKQISIIDKICHHLWDLPTSVRYYNLITENTSSPEIRSWAELYFGCQFLSDSVDKLPRIKSVGSLSNVTVLPILKPLKLSSSSSSPRSNSPSPRLSSSPRILSSPRKLSPTTISNLESIASNCDHVIILGTPENLGLLLKLLGDMTIIVLSNP